MVEPSFLALTTTPSIWPSRGELTSPDTATAVCANAGAGDQEVRATRLMPMVSAIALKYMETSRPNAVIREFRGGVAAFRSVDPCSDRLKKLARRGCPPSGRHLDFLR